jgi:hypothetical protein
LYLKNVNTEIINRHSANLETFGTKFEVENNTLKIIDCPESSIDEVSNQISNEILKIQVKSHQTQKLPGAEKVLNNESFKEKLSQLQSTYKVLNILNFLSCISRD